MNPGSVLVFQTMAVSARPFSVRTQVTTTLTCASVIFRGAPGAALQSAALNRPSTFGPSLATPRPRR
jgi:hypothetical protein